MTTRERDMRENVLTGIGTVLMLGVIIGVLVWGGTREGILLLPGGLLVFLAVLTFQSWQALREEQKRLKTKE